MIDVGNNELRIEWSSRHWSLLAASVISAILGLLGVLVLIIGEGWFVRVGAVFFAGCGGIAVWFAMRDFCWPRTYFLRADAVEVRWGDSRGAATVVQLAQLKRAVLHFESDSQGFRFETVDGGEHQWALLRNDRLQALHAHLTRTCTAEIVKD